VTPVKYCAPLLRTSGLVPSPRSGAALFRH
jgi:hypothetical protein